MALCGAQTEKLVTIPEREALVTLVDIDFAYDELSVLRGVSLSLMSGEAVSLVGPSGCGKSTLLRLIAGLTRPTSGLLNYCDSSNNTRPLLRYMFQDFDAFPWLTVVENVRVGSGVAPHPAEEATYELLDRVGLSSSANSYASELSGGMRKRLALARVLIRRPRLLLLDEPFASLDVDTRLDMYDLLQSLCTENKTSMLIVTHDLNEAVLLADKIAIASSRPMTINTEIKCKLPRPRTVDMMKWDGFAEAMHQVHNSLGLLRI